MRILLISLHTDYMNISSFLSSLYNLLMKETSKSISVRLLIDKKKNKVLLAEASSDFVDVLFSLLTLPMGTIVRLLEKHEKSQPVRVGCFNNLYKSVSDMAIDDFETEACKSMLLYPRSTKEVLCRRLKLNIDDTEATKFFMCKRESCSKSYSNFNTSRCCCGDLMVKEVRVPDKEQLGGQIGNDNGGVFVSCRSSFIVTDDLNVTFSSLGVIGNVLNGLGYTNFNELTEVNRDVGHEEVMTLLECLVTSEAPLTCTFLKKHCMSTMHKMLSPPSLPTFQNKYAKPWIVKVFVRKFDQKILYAESNEDFINALLTYLVISLEFAWSFSYEYTPFGCIKNLLMSECRKAPVSKFLELPYNYRCSQLRSFSYLSGQRYDCLIRRHGFPVPVLSFSRDINKYQLPQGHQVVTVSPIDPKKEAYTSMCSGFLKKDSKFIVSDDLVIIPMRLSTTFGLFKNIQIDFNELEEHTIGISNVEVISILNASFISSSALTNGLSNLISKKVKNEG